MVDSVMVTADIVAAGGGTAAADTSLTTRVSVEESTRATADTSLTTRVSVEESTRATADTSLTTRISTEETTRATAGTSLTTRVSTEEITRGTADTSLTTRQSAAESVQVAVKAISVLAVIDGGGSAITTGTKLRFVVPWAGTITSWDLLADVSGSIVVDIKKSTYAAFPTTATITGSALPTLTAVQKNQSSVLTGWTTSVAAGDVLEFVVNSATTVTNVALTLRIART